MVPGSSPLARTISSPYNSASGRSSNAPSTASTPTVIRKPGIALTLVARVLLSRHPARVPDMEGQSGDACPLGKRGEGEENLEAAALAVIAGFDVAAVGFDEAPGNGQAQ